MLTQFQKERKKKERKKYACSVLERKKERRKREDRNMEEGSSSMQWKNKWRKGGSLTKSRKRDGEGKNMLTHGLERKKEEGKTYFIVT